VSPPVHEPPGRGWFFEQVPQRFSDLPHDPVDFRNFGRLQDLTEGIISRARHPVQTARSRVGSGDGGRAFDTTASIAFIIALWMSSISGACRPSLAYSSGSGCHSGNANRGARMSWPIGSIIRSNSPCRGHIPGRTDRQSVFAISSLIKQSGKGGTSLSVIEDVSLRNLTTDESMSWGTRRGSHGEKSSSEFIWSTGTDASTMG